MGNLLHSLKYDAMHLAFEVYNSTQTIVQKYPIETTGQLSTKKVKSTLIFKQNRLNSELALHNSKS